MTNAEKFKETFGFSLESIHFPLYTFWDEEYKGPIKNIIIKKDAIKKHDEKASDDN